MAIAHITFCDDKRLVQSLNDHSKNTAIYARETLEKVGFGELGYISGLLHDMGKGTRAFDVYIEDSVNGAENSTKIIHTFTGAVYILEKYHKLNNPVWAITSEVVAYAIGAHHGLFDVVDMQDQNGFLHRMQKDKDSLYYQEALLYFFNNITSEKDIEICFMKAASEMENFLNNLKKKVKENKSSFSIKMMLGFLTRLVLSAVIYGDRKDTRQFMSQSSDPVFSQDWEQEESILENRLASFHEESQLNSVRKDISNQCAEAAKREGGLFQLSVPTGGGKTLSTLRYALRHANQHKKKRIFFVIPLLSILDQNAEVIKKNLSSAEIVLEHHSNVVKEKKQKEELDKYELLTNTWESPVVITTLVQLLNTFFSGKTSEVGRFQALTDSVIVIDEIQTIPNKTINMFNRMINFLCYFCNTTVVFSSATQPELESVKWPIVYAAEKELVTLTEEKMKAFHRYEIVDCVDPYGKDLDEIASFGFDILENHKALLVVCNTKSEARQIYEEVVKLNMNPQCEIFHLSTSMCKEHRMKVLRNITTTLSFIQRNKSTNKRIICISTQLVEAGIDFSFDAVIRLLAGLDNLAQAAGRCNRSNEYGTLGHVYLVNIKNESRFLSNLPEIIAAQNATVQTIKSQYEGELIGTSAIKNFYRYKFKELINQKRDLLLYPINTSQYENNIYLAELLEENKMLYSEKNKEFLLSQPFKYVGERFSVFSEDSVDVLVPYGDGVKIIEKLREIHKYRLPLELTRELIKQSNAFTVTIFENELKALGQWIEPLFDGRIYVLSENLYKNDIGFSKNEINNSGIFM